MTISKTDAARLATVSRTLTERAAAFQNPEMRQNYFRGRSINSKDPYERALAGQAFRAGQYRQRLAEIRKEFTALDSAVDDVRGAFPSDGNVKVPTRAARMKELEAESERVQRYLQGLAGQDGQHELGHAVVAASAFYAQEAEAATEIAEMRAAGEAKANIQAHPHATDMLAAAARVKAGLPATQSAENGQ